MATWTTSRWAKLLANLLLISGLIVASLNSQAGTATRTSAFEYDPVSGLLTKEIIEPGDSNLCLVTEYTYDAFGNKSGATTRNCNGSAGSVPGVNSEAAAPTAGSDAIFTSRTSTTTYDSNGRFPITSSNALGQTENKQFDQRFGGVKNLTGPNGLITTWDYDTFGRNYNETRADSTYTTITYALCNSTCASASSNAQYKITSAQVGAPTSVTYYDSFGRAIQTESQDMFGATIYSRKEYDDLGRVSRTSRPSKSTSQFIWTTVEYDTLDRPYRTTSLDSMGANAVSTVAYNGYTTITTNAKGQTKTELKNSQGQLVSVSDAYNKTISYQYDAFGNLIKTTDAANNITTITYDLRGRKKSMNDPDQGLWTYDYDALGQLKRQTDAKNQVVTFQYDKLGRMTQRNEPDLVSTWAYDTCDAALNTNGKCIGKPVKETANNGYSRTYLYDTLGRATAELDNIDAGYGVIKSFDSYGRVNTLVYPNSFSTSNLYSATGYLIEVRNTSTSALYWQANTTDNEGNLNQYTYGNNVIVNNRTYNAYTGVVTQISAGSVSGTGNNGSVSNQVFEYDSIGNLKKRYDAVTGLYETFGYDSLNRLTGTSAQVGSGAQTQVSLTYDDIGNIKTKSDVGIYTYGSSKPHAVTQIMMNDGVTVYANYTYDANGNMYTGAGRTTVWNSWNMPNSIEGTIPGKSTPAGTPSTFAFVYNSAHERVKETLPNQTAIYNISPRVDTGIHVEKQVKTDGTILYVNYLYAGSMPFGTVTVTNPPNNGTQTTQTRFFHTDHLGSVIAITNENGVVTETRSYDAWGKRRNPDGTSMTNAFVTPQERHGFTGHEEMDEVALIHMNGRIYDPAISRFMSADPTIQYPNDMQNYNRYSYINNSPLSSVDMSGFGFFSSLEKAFIRPILHLVRDNEVVRTGLAIAVAWNIAIGPGGYGIFGAGGAYGEVSLAVGSYTAAVMNGVTAGFAAGLIGSGGDLNSAFSGALSGALFSWAGNIGGEFGEYGFAHFGAHAAAGCLGAVASGGECGRGAGSALAGKFATWATDGGMIATVIAGGTASAIGGGKFANGALTAGFGYLFNYCASTGSCSSKFEQSLYDWWPAYKIGTCINNGDCSTNQYGLAAGAAAIDILGGVEVKGLRAALVVERITGKELSNLAESLGYDRIVKAPPFNSMGEKVFTNGSRYISQDRTMHTGPAWKVFDSSGKRVGTYTLDLATKIRD